MIVRQGLSALQFARRGGLRCCCGFCAVRERLTMQRAEIALAKTTVFLYSSPVISATERVWPHLAHISDAVHHRKNDSWTTRKARAKRAEKSKALAAALAQIEKQFGKGSIMRLGADDAGRRSPGRLDRLARPGHRARRRRLAARPHRRNLRTGIVGQDHADSASRSPKCKSWAAPAASSTPNTRSTSTTRRSSASTLSDLLISQPDTGEQALEITDALVRSGSVDMIVIDSVAALMPRPKSKATWATRCRACRRA